ncbi:hypothetical protein SAMN02910413_1985 [Pseudobutyrivibrio sp. C4]|nr:hypothetical protein SAMN02910413_1985 [Pseudobutyrivibrio sp. C4]
MLPCDAKKNYNPCAVCVNKHIAHTTGGQFHENLEGGAWAGVQCRGRGHIKVEFGGMVCYTLREYRYEGDAYEQYV